MKTLDRKRTYRRGFFYGIALGLLLGAALASLFSWRLSMRSMAEGKRVRSSDVATAVALGVLGVALGVGGGIAWAAVTTTIASGESREFLREAAPPAVFPGMFGNPGSDPFQAYKERIDAEEGAEEEPAPAAPAKMPDVCPACGKKLETEEPIAFCYHCGGALSS
ncbi:MAG TPA: hypothetical protein VFF73_41785 [Planctomycetota bacterium]|nr:hypothetical protein [Planctomycetota bacterium]